MIDLSGGGSSIKSIQNHMFFFNNDGLTQDFTIPEVDKDKSIVVRTGQTAANVSQNQNRGFLTLIDSTTVRVKRYVVSTGDPYFSAQVITFNAPKYIANVDVYMFGGQAIATAAMPEVDPDKTLIFSRGEYVDNSGMTIAEIEMTVKIKTPTLVEISRLTGIDRSDYYGTLVEL